MTKGDTVCNISDAETNTLNQSVESAGVAFV